MILVDRQATAERRFEHSKSRVLKDGRLILIGEDWTEQKVALFLRSNGKCERYSILGRPHDAWCSGKSEEAHHIIARSKGRDDRMPNLAGLSHACHSAEDPRKVRSDKLERRTKRQGEAAA